MTHLIIAGVAIAVGCMIIGIMIGLEIGDRRINRMTYLLGTLSNWEDEQ